MDSAAHPNQEATMNDATPYSQETKWTRPAKDTKWGTWPAKETQWVRKADLAWIRMARERMAARKEG
jgi:hypothetical protein